MPDFVRKRNRLPLDRCLGRRWYFVTICTGDRCPLFSDARLVPLILETLRGSCHSHSFDLYAYCFMPDHLHLELVARSDQCDLVALLRYFKGAATAEARDLNLRRLWQRGFYDHILREGENENAVAWYIFENPARKGLVKDAHEWAYSGSWVFDWKKFVAPLDRFVPSW